MDHQVNNRFIFRGSTIISIGIAATLLLIMGFYVWQSSIHRNVLDDTSTTLDNNNVQGGESLLDSVSFTPAEIRESYYQSIEQLMQEVVSQASLPAYELIALVEERMLDIRVPHEARDEYIDIFLSIQSLIHETDGVVHDRIISYLQSLL